jgi:hypothetical protein
MAGRYRKPGPAARPDAASLDTWAAWAGLGAPTDEYPQREAAHRAPGLLDRLAARLDRVLTRTPSRG